MQKKTYKWSIAHDIWIKMYNLLTNINILVITLTYGDSTLSVIPPYYKRRQSKDMTIRVSEVIVFCSIVIFNFYLVSPV